ncbi:MAG: hypothetical protein M0R70_15390 [Nitrospirae bacterium]|nr:hypothetical protein [Nitrospirota bacterium]
MKILLSIVLCISPMLFSSVSMANDAEKSVALYKKCGMWATHCLKREQEKEFISNFGELAFRDKNILHLRLYSKNITVSISDNDGEESFAAYTFLDLLRFDQTTFYVLSVTWYEGYGVVLVNYFDGTIYSINSIPILSPDSKHFAVASADLQVGYWANTITIYKTANNTKNQIVVDFQHSIPASDPKWIDNKTLEFQEVSTSDHGVTLHYTKRIITLTKDGWKLRQNKQVSS